MVAYIGVAQIVRLRRPAFAPRTRYGYFRIYILLRREDGSRDLSSVFDALAAGREEARVLLEHLQNRLDPADSIYATGEAKVRPQWRTSSSKLAATMGQLYSKSRVIFLERSGGVC